jgi:hypothetical protein
VLDWFQERSLRAYSISCGAALLYNDIFPKHRERLGKKMSELVGGEGEGQRPTGWQLWIVRAVRLWACFIPLCLDKRGSWCTRTSYSCEERCSHCHMNLLCYNILLLNASYIHCGCSLLPKCQLYPELHVDALPIV